MKKPDQKIPVKDKLNALDLAYSIATDSRNEKRYAFTALTDPKTMERFGYGDMLRVLEAMYDEIRKAPDMQKPLTKDELRELCAADHEVVVYCEAKGSESTYATIIFDGKTFDREGEAPGVEHLSFETYGVFWRAWATRPTDEERAAAPWEE